MTVGPLGEFLAADHRRLEALLDRATADPEAVDQILFEEFRAGLLRHIGMEEKILLPAARRALGGNPLPIARRLRLDHGAIAAMLVPTPSAKSVARLRQMLALHDALEEGPDAVYDECDRLLSGEVTELLRSLETYPAVRTRPHSDGPGVEAHIRETLELAGRSEIK